MRRFFSLGDGVPMTTVTLLVCAPVLFGLALIFVEPFRNPSWMLNDLQNAVQNPGMHPVFTFWVLFLLHSVLAPNTAVGNEEEQEARASSSMLTRTADILWSLAAGMLLCLMILIDRDTVGTGRENVVAYIALVLTIINIALRWRDCREQRGFGRQAE